MVNRFNETLTVRWTQNLNTLGMEISDMLWRLAVDIVRYFIFCLIRGLFLILHHEMLCYFRANWSINLNKKGNETMDGFVELKYSVAFRL